jgi:hypothetical protein
MTTYTGSNSERQSVGLPGHCDDCAETGHVAAHPDLGCSDVGCDTAHPEEPETATGQDADPQAAAARALGHPWPLPTDEHPDLTKMRLREIEALTRGYVDGDVNHNVQPIIGWMRLLEAKGEAPTVDDLTDWIPRLFAACDAENALLAERKAASRAADGAPLTAVVSRGTSRPETITSADWRSWATAVPVYVWNALRRAGAPQTFLPHPEDLATTWAVPTGWLYTPTGAHRLDETLRRMWTCPEAVALRDVPHMGAAQYQDPHLATQEQAQFAMNRIWADFLSAAGYPLAAQEKA